MTPRHIVHLHHLTKNQWRSWGELEKIQNAKLSRLIRHAYDRVPYYKELFRSAGIVPSDIRTSQDLVRIPVTSRQTMHDLALRDRMAQGVDPKACRVSATSGTTGIPLKIYFDPHDSTMNGLSWARAFLASGMKPWHRMLAFVGRQTVREGKSWYEYLNLWRREEISAWAGPDIWIQRIQELQPHVLIGYVMTLRILAEAIERKRIANLSPRMIFHSSAILDHSSRHFLESILRCRIVDMYGSDEAGCIAWECSECSGYHLSSDMMILELVRGAEPAVPGEEGEVLVTNLHSYAMPFIRYTQGDVAVLSARNPQCGRGLPLLERVIGRTDDFVVLRDGTKISPHPLYHCIDPVIGVKRWRIAQESLHRITVELALEESQREVICNTVKENLTALTRDQLEITIRVVDTIPIDPSSKFRAVSSSLGSINQSASRN